MKKKRQERFIQTQTKVGTYHVPWRKVVQGAKFFGLRRKWNGSFAFVFGCGFLRRETGTVKTGAERTEKYLTTKFQAENL